MKTTLFPALGLFLMGLLSGPALADEFPAGAMHDFVARTCTQCHAAAQVTAQRKTRAGWYDTVNQMVANGAPVSDAQFDKVVDYLAASFPAK